MFCPSCFGTNPNMVRIMAERSRPPSSHKKLTDENNMNGKSKRRKPNIEHGSDVGKAPLDYDHLLENQFSGIKNEKPDYIDTLTHIQHEQEQTIIKGIVHDINNNLMAILSACDEIERKSTLITEMDWAFNTIRMHVKSSALLLRDLIANHSSEPFEILNQDELQAFLKSILPSLSLLAGEKTNIELGSVVTPPVGIHRMLLHRVLMQFLRNVSELSNYHPLAFISVRKVKTWCEISVSDNGPGLIGVSSDDVFSPGVTTKDEHGARGYGLSAVAWAVQYWKGEYGVESIENDTG